MSETRKLAAILVADVVGYSRLAGADEDRTLARLKGLRSDLIDPAITVHHGRIVKRTGDGSIIELRKWLIPGGFQGVLEKITAAVPSFRSSEGELPPSGEREKLFSPQR
jgi:hypothetical protein